MVHGAYMGPNWGQQDPGGPHVGPMNLANWDDQMLVKIMAIDALMLEVISTPHHPPYA